MTRTRSGALAVVAASLFGCTVGGVRQTAFTGPAPSAVLVLPPIAVPDASGQDLRAFAMGADRALAGRGYRCMPLGAGYDLARRCGALEGGRPEPDALRRLRDQVGVDAVMQIEVSVWRPIVEPRLSAASWDVTWRLVSTETGAQVWSQRLQGNWSQPYEAPDHLVRDPMEPQPAVIGGTLRDSFRSEPELVAALHAAACARLPENAR